MAEGGRAGTVGTTIFTAGIRFATPAGALLGSFFAGLGATVETTVPFSGPTGAAFTLAVSVSLVPRPKLCGELVFPCAAANANANPALCPKNCAADAAGTLDTPLELVATIAFMLFASANCGTLVSDPCTRVTIFACAETETRSSLN
jgi:hypothetical protein